MTQEDFSARWQTSTLDNPSVGGRSKHSGGRQLKVRISSFEEQFFADQTAVDEDGSTRFDLRNIVLKYCPWYRGKRIVEDFTDQFQKCLITTDVGELKGALTLTRLRYAFFSILDDSGWNLHHINTFEKEAMTVYWRRFSDRLEQATNGYRTKDRVVATQLPEKTLHVWMN